MTEFITAKEMIVLLFVNVIPSINYLILLRWVYKNSVRICRIESELNKIKR